MELVATFFSIFEGNALIMIIVNCEEEEWNKLMNSPFRIYYNRMFKIFGIQYDNFPTLSPGIAIDNEDTLKMVKSWLDTVVKNKRYTILYIKTSPPAISLFVTIPVEDTSIFQEILNDLKTAKGGKT